MDSVNKSTNGMELYAEMMKYTILPDDGHLGAVTHDS